MSPESEKPVRERSGRTLIKAFTFAGVILAIGAFGLVRTVLLFGMELGWFSVEPSLGPFYCWLCGGVVFGLVMGLVVVRVGKTKQ